MNDVPCRVMSDLARYEQQRGEDRFDPYDDQHMREVAGKDLGPLMLDLYLTQRCSRLQLTQEQQMERLKEYDAIAKKIQAVLRERWEEL